MLVCITTLNIFTRFSHILFVFYSSPIYLSVWIICLINSNWFLKHMMTPSNCFFFWPKTPKILNPEIWWWLDVYYLTILSVIKFWNLTGFFCFFFHSALLEQSLLLEAHFPPPDTAKLTYQEETEWLTVKRQHSSKEQKKTQTEQDNKQDLCLQSHGSTQDRNTETDCSFTVHRGTDQRHTESRGKPWQHTATKSSTTTMKGSSEARKSGEQLCLSLFIVDGNTAPDKARCFCVFLLHCNRHTKGIKSYRMHIQTHIEQDVRVRCSGVTKTGVLGFGAARAEDTHEGVEVF